jgi:hypothetical protein
VSATAAATVTVSVWVPVIAAGIGAGAAVIAGVITQVWSSHRDKKQWLRERDERRAQWDQERQARQQLWAREDSRQWLQHRQQTYAEFVSALYEWDVLLGAAMGTRLTQLALTGHRGPLDIRPAMDQRRSARGQLALVQFMGPTEVRQKAQSAVTERESS